MKSIKEIRPSFDRLGSVADSDEFVRSFCLKTLDLIKEFKLKYGSAITGQNIDELDAITHKISSTMKWLSLDDFVSLTRQYKNFSASDENTFAELLSDVMCHSDMIEDSIRIKLAELKG